MIESKKERKNIEKSFQEELSRLELPMVRSLFVGTHPVTKSYPCRELIVAISIYTDFPDDIDDTYPTEGELQHNFEYGNVSLMTWPPKNIGEESVKEKLIPFVKSLDSLIAPKMESLGCREYSAKHHHWNNPGDCGHVPSVMFPPYVYFDDPKMKSEAAKYGHWMSDPQVKIFTEEMGREPFSDEAWITDRYSGVNIFRGARFRKEWAREDLR